MYLLDTNVLSELRKINKGQCDISVLAWSKTVEPDQLYISVVSVLEIEIGILLLQRRDQVAAASLRLWLREQVIGSFDDRILGIDLEIALVCASFHVPKNRPDRDALLGATAFVRGLTVVTRNIRDFQGTGVRLLNPWES